MLSSSNQRLTGQLLAGEPEHKMLWLVERNGYPPFFIERGDLEAGIGGDMPALTAAAESRVLITTVVQQGFTSIVFRKNMTIEGLKGKRIGYAFGSNAHYALLQALDSGGIRENDVHLMPYEVNEMPAALDRGEIDAFSAWEPTPAEAKLQFSDQTAIHRSFTSGYLYFSRSFAEQHLGGRTEF